MRCLCRKGQNGDPSWKKSCSWSFNNALWSTSDTDGVQCERSEFTFPTTIGPTTIIADLDPSEIGTRIYRYDLMYQNEVVFPNYEVSVDLKLEENTHEYWSNILGFHQAHHRSITKNGNFVLGGRIPAVFVKPAENRLVICSAVGTNGNTCWDSEEYTVGEWFNLKIQECFKISSAHTKWPS